METSFSWYFRNNSWPLVTDLFWHEANTRNSKVLIETYPTCLEERAIHTGIPSKGYNNLRKDNLSFYSLKEDTDIIIKRPLKWSVVAILKGEDCTKEVFKQLDDKKKYDEVLNYLISLLIQ